MSDDAVITFFDSAGMLLSTLSDLNMSPPEVKKINRDKALDIFQDLCLTSTLDNEDEFGQVCLTALEEQMKFPRILKIPLLNLFQLFAARSRPIRS